MSLPIKRRTNLVAWFREACEKCREIYVNAVIEYVKSHEDEVKEALLKGEPMPITVNIYDKLCPKCKKLMKEYTEVWVDKNELKEMLLRGACSQVSPKAKHSPRPPRKKRRERG